MNRDALLNPTEVDGIPRARCIDATLTMSAEGLVLSEQFRDDDGASNLREYVNALINTDSRGLTLPGEELGDPGGSLERLFLFGTAHIRPASLIRGLGSATLPPPEAQIVAEVLLYEAHNQPGKVARFVRHQMTSRVVDQYATRIVDWAAQMEEAIDAVRKLENAGEEELQALQRLESAIAKEFSDVAFTPDIRHREQAFRNRVALGRYGIALFYNWLARGRRYRSRLALTEPDVPFAAHARRLLVTRVPGLDPVAQVRHLLEPRWGDLIVEACRDGRIRDILHLTEVLDGIYEHTHDPNGGYWEALQDAERTLHEVAEQKGESAVIEAMADVIVRTEPRLLLRRSRHQPLPIAPGVPEAIALVSAHWTSPFTRPIYELLVVVSESGPFQRREFNWRRRVRRGSQWKAFRLPPLVP